MAKACGLVYAPIVQCHRNYAKNQELLNQLPHQHVAVLLPSDSANRSSDVRTSFLTLEHLRNDIHPPPRSLIHRPSRILECILDDLLQAPPERLQSDHRLPLVDREAQPVAIKDDDPGMEAEVGVASEEE